MIDWVDRCLLSGWVSWVDDWKLGWRLKQTYSKVINELVCVSEWEIKSRYKAQDRSTTLRGVSNCWICNIPLISHETQPTSWLTAATATIVAVHTLWCEVHPASAFGEGDKRSCCGFATQGCWSLCAGSELLVFCFVQFCSIGLILDIKQWFIYSNSEHFYHVSKQIETRSC